MTVQKINFHVGPHFKSLAASNNSHSEQIKRPKIAQNKGFTSLLNTVPDAIRLPLKAQPLSKEKNKIRFGVVDPTSLVIWLGTPTIEAWLGNIIGRKAFREGLKLALQDMDNHKGIGLDSSKKFIRAKGMLELVENLHEPDVQTKYLIKVEKLFVGAASEVSENYKKSEYLKYATIAAKMAGRSPKTVLDFANMALKYRSKAHIEIKAIEKELEEDFDRSTSIQAKMIRGVIGLLSLPLLAITVGHSKVVNKVLGICDRVNGEMSLEEYEAKRKIVAEFSHTDNCYQVCSKIKKQADKAIANSSKSENVEFLPSPDGGSTE